jgi:choline dehydrogenase-like flavoprotein
MPIETFSHALGTCRMGKKSETSVVDANCRVHGMENLYVIDGSVMPSGGSVNPSLTIAALSLKAADSLS